jgi:exopolysaccharide biosynthesis polyprenyl glycosylphosphotransferase
MTATDSTRAHLQVREGYATRPREISPVQAPLKHAIIPSGRWLQVVYVIVDIMFISLDDVAASSLRSGAWPKLSNLLEIFSRTGWRAIDQSMNFHFALLTLYVALIVVCCQNQQLYRTMRTRDSFDETASVLKAVGLATLLLGAFIFLSGVNGVARSVVGFSAVLNCATLAGWRVLRRHIVRRRVRNGLGSRDVLIIGAGKVGKSLAQYFQLNPHLGYVVKGFLDEHVNGDSTVLGSIEDLPRVAQSHFADEIFITIPQHRMLVKKVVLEARKHKLDVSVIPELFDGLGHHAPIKYLGDLPVMELHREPIPEIGLLFKRVVDILVAAIVMLLCAPLLVVLAVAIKLDSPGPVFYCAPRVGRKGRLFTCFKLRTMSMDADLKKGELRHLNERSGPFFKITDDPRITSTGKWLRRFSLDELPQLWNVMKGDMSLVGPRPHPVDDYKNYDLAHMRRLDVCPGLTGLWQVTARRDASFEKSMELDLDYIENWSFWLDLTILMKTVPEVLKASGT